MNNQEAFDKMVTHLRAQKTRSTNATSGFCAYRGENVTMCAVGCLIPDELYVTEMESKPVIDVIDFNPTICEFFSGLIITMLEEMQITHDVVHPLVWESQFRRIANKYGLTLKGTS